MRPVAQAGVQDLSGWASKLSGPGAVFRLSGGEGVWITICVELGREPELAADIVFRYLERLGQALAGRLEWLQSVDSDASTAWVPLVSAGADKTRTVVSAPQRRELLGMPGAISRIFGLRLHVQQPHAKTSTPRLPVVEPMTAPTGLARR